MNTQIVNKYAEQHESKLNSQQHIITCKQASGIHKCQ